MTVETLNAAVGLDVRPLRAGIQQAQVMTANFGQALQQNLAASAARAAAALGGVNSSAGSAGRSVQGLGSAANNAGNQIQNGLTSKLNAAQSALGKFGSAATSAGKRLSLLVTLPLEELGRKALQVEANFESSMNQLQGATGATAAQMDVLGKKATALGADLTLPGTSAADAANAMLNLSRAGLNMREVFDASLPTLQLSAATHVENAKAAEILAVTLREFGLQGRDAAKAADLLTAAGNRTVGGIQSLYEGLRKAGPTMHDLNVPLHDTVTALALLNAGGLKGAEAGTVLRGIFAKLADPTKKMQAAMSAVGLTFFDSSGKMKSLADISEMLKTKLGGLTDKQRAMVEHILGGNRAMAGLSILAREGAAGFDAMGKKIGVAGEASRQATAQMKGIPGAIEAIKSGFETAAQGAIEPFSKDLAALGRRVGELLTAFASLPPQTRRMWVEIAAGAALLGPVLLGLGQFAFALKNLIGVFSLVRTGFGLLTALMGGPVTLAITAIIALVALLVVAWVRDWGHIQEKTRAVLKTIQQTIEDVVEPIKLAWNGLVGGLKKAWSDMWGDIKSAIGLNAPEVQTALGTALPPIKGEWDAFCDSLPAKWTSTWQKIANAKIGGSTVMELLMAATGNETGAPGSIMARSQERFERNLANEEAKSSAQKAFGTATPGMGDLLAYDDKQNPFIGPRLPANLLGKSSPGGSGPKITPHHNSALDNIGKGEPKLSPLQKEQKRYAEELAQAHERLRAVLVGEDNIAAQVAGRYHLMHLNGKDDLTTTLQRIKAREKETERVKAFRDALNGVYAEIKDIRAFDPTTKLMNKLGRMTPQEQGLYRAAISTKEKESDDQVAENKRIQEKRSALEAVTNQVKEMERAQMAAAAASKYGPINRESLALLSDFKSHYEDLDAVQRRLIDQMYRFKLSEKNAADELKQFEFNQKGWNAISQRVDEANKRFRVLTGTSTEAADSITALANSIDFMDLEMVNAALDVLELDKRNTDLAAAQEHAKEMADRQKAAFEALFAELERHQAVIRDLDVDYQKLTHGSLKDQIALNSEWKTTYDKLTEAAKKWVDAVAAGMKKIKEESKKLDFLKQFADGFQNVFEQAFGNLHNGFKSFFKSIVEGFEQMLMQIAAKYLASELTNVVFGQADENGNRHAGWIGGLLGGLFGGGGGGGGGITDMSQIVGKAGGGLVAQDTPYLVGERGPELFTPSRSGRITPNAQLAGAGGPVIHQTINIHAADLNSFNRSQHQIAADMNRMAREASRRSGR